MLSSRLCIAILAVLSAGPAYAKVIRVEVVEGRLAFTPENIQAAISSIHLSVAGAFYSTAYGHVRIRL